MRYIFALWKPNGESPGWSNEYSPEWGDRLARSIRRHNPDAEIVTITDYDKEDFGEDIECHEFLYGSRDWSSMMELYRPEIVKDRAILVGLDTICTGDLEDIDDLVLHDGYCHIMPLDPYFSPKTCNGVVGVNFGTSQEIWFNWTAKAARGARDSEEYRMFGRFSEMVYLRKNAKASDLWDEVAPGQVLSYKVHVRPARHLPERAKLVYFHGTPKPQQIKDDWLEEHWA